MTAPPETTPGKTHGGPRSSWPSGRERAEVLARARRRLRRRAIAEALILCAGVVLVPALVADPLDALLAALAAAGAAIVIFLARRSNDLATYAREARARNRALEGHGVPLAAWHAGAPLGPWMERQPVHERPA
ncbi:hypothetical protein [Thermaurantiacus sp.]